MPLITAVKRILLMIEARHHSPEALAAIAGHADFRIAVAALLVYAGNVDGEFVAAERAVVRALLSARLGLSGQDADEMMMLVNSPKLLGDDLDELAQVLRAQLDADGMLRVLEMVWEIVVADARIDPNEAERLARIGAMLRVPAAALDEMGLRYRARLAG